MELIPAIDLLGGKVVRLRQGRYDDVTVYSDDPAAQAGAFRAQGARRLHVIDLDGARDGVPGNVDAVRAILASSATTAVQVGGGVRDSRSVETWLEAGADRVVLGTAALERPQEVRALCAAHPGRIVVAVDALEGEVMIAGWRERTGTDALSLAREVDSWGAVAILHTSIARDGTRGGPDVDATAAMQRAVSATVIASGGIGTIDHVRTLESAGVRAAVCGRALYEGTLSLREALLVAGGG